MVAQTSGTDLCVPLTSPRFQKGKPFLSHTQTLSDILAKDGYNQEICIGSDATFGGRRYYFDAHGPIHIFDYEQSKSKLPPDYHEFWGFEDEKLFAFAKEEILHLANQKQPFHFSLLTVDTHHPKGYIDSHVQNEYPERMSNIIRASSQKVGEFVEWIKEQPFYDDTTIVICGDHTSMAAKYINKTYDKNYTRTVFNTIIHSEQKPIHSKNRTFTTMDLFPTVLSAMGYKIEGDKLGFGTNLFSDKDTLPETIGLKKFDQELRKQSDYYKKYIL